MMENTAVLDSLPVGFQYTIEHVRDGKVIHTETVENLVPNEGLTHILSVILKAGAQAANWYVGIFEGNYTPTAGITAATVVATAGESTAYAAATRPAWTGGTISGNAVDNSAAKAAFVMNADKTIYGGFLVSASAKGATSGTLLSCVRFAAPRALLSGDTLNITAGLALTSA